MRTKHKGPDGLTNFYCIKCDYCAGALPRATVWCPKGHRMSTKKQIEEAEQRRTERAAKKELKNV